MGLREISSEKEEEEEEGFGGEEYVRKSVEMNVELKTAEVSALNSPPDFPQNSPPKVVAAKTNVGSTSSSSKIKQKPFLPITVWTKPVKKEKTEDTLSRHEFRATIGVAFTNDILSGKYSYEEVINKFKNLYPNYEHKFTKSFCSKIRCGRIMNGTTNTTIGITKTKHRDHRMKRTTKLSQRKDWTRMTPDLFEKILNWENGLKRAVKQSEIEMVWNVNRTTYHRWKKNYNNNLSNV